MYIHKYVSINIFFSGKSSVNFFVCFFFVFFVFVFCCFCYLFMLAGGLMVNGGFKYLDKKCRCYVYILWSLICVVCIHTTMYQTYNTMYISNSLFPIIFFSVFCFTSLISFIFENSKGWDWVGISNLYNHQWLCLPRSHEFQEG